MREGRGYPGGKGGMGVFQTIINHMPPHDVYVEAFAGSGVVMRAKRPAQRNVAIDRSSAALAALLSHYIGAGDTGRQGDAADALRSTNVVTVDNADGLRWEFVRGDCQAWFRQQIWRGHELVYADPPYLRSVRASGRLFYEYELAEESEHVALLTQLRALPCMVMVSGYWSELYADMLPDWTTVTYTTVTLGGTVAEEWLWMNYPLPAALHDYQYLGADYRERERIKRKVNRWRQRLAAMPLLERQALMMALSDTDLAAASPDLASVATSIEELF